MLASFSTFAKQTSEGDMPEACWEYSTFAKQTSKGDMPEVNFECKEEQR